MMKGTVEERLRRFLLALAICVFLATLVELVLEEHTKETLQFVPFVLCAIGLIAAGAVLRHPVRRTLLALRAAMIVVALGGAIGAGIHLWRNFEFERDVRPNAAFTALVVATLKG